MTQNAPIMPTIKPYGDHALLLEWATDGFDAGVNDRVHTVSSALRESGRYREVVPGYDSLACTFDLGAQSLSTASEHVGETLLRDDLDAAKVGKLVEVPVHYGGEDGPDMATICKSAKMDEDAVIALHSGQDYRVCMMGFIPGFSFLSPPPKALHHPRLATPRAKVPAGSVGIANWQTGIYGLESPGGWQLIGRTDLAIFDATRDTPFALEAGDRVRFVPQ